MGGKRQRERGREKGRERARETERERARAQHSTAQSTVNTVQCVFRVHSCATKPLESLAPASCPGRGRGRDSSASHPDPHFPAACGQARPLNETQTSLQAHGGRPRLKNRGSRSTSIPCSVEPSETGECCVDEVTRQVRVKIASCNAHGPTLLNDTGQHDTCLTC